MRRWLTQMGIYGFLVLVTIVTLYPLLWVVGLAIGDGQRRGGLNPFASAPSLDGFQTLLGAFEDAETMLELAKEMEDEDSMEEGQQMLLDLNLTVKLEQVSRLQQQQQKV